MTVRIVRIVDLISDAPQNDGRMIAVTPYHGAQILFVPFREIFKIALMFWRIDIVSRRPFIFRIFPLVKLIQNIKGKKENICSALAHLQRIAVKIIYYGILVAFLFLC